jgi:hypothetical protein
METNEDKYQVIIDDKRFSFTDPIVTGSQLLNAAKKRPIDEDIIYQWLEDGQLEEIRIQESVDLTKPGMERFITFKSAESYRFTIDGQKFEWGAPEITGRKLKILADVDPLIFDIWMEVRGQGDDKLIQDKDFVSLDTPGLERFYTKEVCTEIYINGTPRNVSKQRLSFSEIVELAFPGTPSSSTIYTVVYKHGPEESPQGSLVEGQIVTIKNRMIFNVTQTDKS